MIFNFNYQARDQMAKDIVDATYKSIREGVEVGDENSILALRRLIIQDSRTYRNNTLVSALIPAAVSDNQLKVITLIGETRYSLGEDILYAAIVKDNATVIEKLIKIDALPHLNEDDQNERINSLLKILYQACENGALKCFLLIETKLIQEYNFISADYYKKFLAAAAKGGRLEIPNLIKKRNQINNNDPENNFSSMLAVKHEHYAINLLIVACRNGKLEFVKYLKENVTSDVYNELIYDKTYAGYMWFGFFDHMRIKGSFAYNEAIKVGCLEIAKYLLETAANLETRLHMGLSDDLMRVNSNAQVQAFVKDTNKFNAGIRDNNLGDINELFNVQLDSEDRIINIEPSANITYKLIKSTFFDKTRPLNIAMDLLLEKIGESYYKKHTESLVVSYPPRGSPVTEGPSEFRFLPSSVISVIGTFLGHDLHDMMPKNSEISSPQLDEKLLFER